MEGCQGGPASHHDQNNRKIGIQWTRVRSFSPVDGKKIEKQKLWSTHPPSWSRQERRGWARWASRRKNICIPAFQINHSTDNCLPWLNFLWLQADVDLVVSYKRLVGVKSSLLAWTATTLTLTSSKEQPITVCWFEQCPNRLKDFLKKMKTNNC